MSSDAPWVDTDEAPLLPGEEICDSCTLARWSGVPECPNCELWPVAKFCWCGGRVGTREPGDKDGLGCRENVMHEWEVPDA